MHADPGRKIHEAAESTGFRRQTDMSRPKIPTARDMMHARPMTVRPDSEIEAAVRQLIKRGYSGAPVVDERDRLVGVLSEHDCIGVLTRAISEGWPGGTVEKHMTTDVETVAPSEDAFTISARFAQGRHRRLLVVEDDRLIGLISRRDLMKALEETEEAMQRSAGKSTYELIDERRRKLD
jgi:CBS domain-containing protein